MPPRMNTTALGLTQLSQLPALPLLDDTDIGGPPLNVSWASGNAHIINPLLQSMQRPVVTDDCMRDPLADSFYDAVWHKTAENNTKMYRQVFRCMPDSEVQSWPQYRAFEHYSERFMASQGLGAQPNKPKNPKDAPDTSGPPGSGGTDVLSAVLTERTGSFGKGRLSGLGRFLHRPRSNTSSTTSAGALDPNEKARQDPESHGSDSVTVTGNTPDEEAIAAATALDEKLAAKREAEAAAGAPTTDGNTATTTTAASGSPMLDGAADTTSSSTAVPSNVGVGVSKARTVQYADDEKTAPLAGQAFTDPATTNIPQHTNSQRRRRRGTTKGSGGKPNFPAAGAGMEEVLSKDEAEGLLKLVQGHLVLWPYDWLEKEERGGNWLYNIDQLAPLEI